MSTFEIVSILVTLAALLSFLNYHFIKLPTTIGVMLIALGISVVLIVAGRFGLPLHEPAAQFLKSFPFNQALMQGMLSFLLFAGALHINLNDLHEEKFTVFVLSTVGVLLSTLVFGTAIYFVLRALGLQMGYMYCLLFGALISPTDPVAVMGILKRAGAPKQLEVTIAGESLFNDGVGVVVFLVIFGIAVQHEAATASHVLILTLREAVGGVLFGLAAGWIAYRMLRTVDKYDVEILITVGLVMGGYAAASALHTSGPLAIAVAGLLIGNHGRRFAMSQTTREHLDMFWELIDEILNALLFLLIGLEVLVLNFSRPLIIAAIIAIPVILFARLVSVGLPFIVLPRLRSLPRSALTIMTWGGLRGGISVAMALSLPPGPERELILAVTYVIVVFSIAVQGTTVQKLISKSLHR